MPSQIELAANHLALKEWSSVCHAVRAGRQVLFFRTGGIAEDTDGFHLKYPEFWLFPTHFHEADVLLNADAGEGFADQPDANVAEIPIQDYCLVHKVLFVDDFRRLTGLSRWHILTERVLQTRFDYRSPGLFVILVRAYRTLVPAMVANRPKYDGCKSWVEFDQALPTGDLQPALTDADFAEIVVEVETSLINPD